MLFVQITIMRGEINQEIDLLTFYVVDLYDSFASDCASNYVVQIYTNKSIQKIRFFTST